MTRGRPEREKDTYLGSFYTNSIVSGGWDLGFCLDRDLLTYIDSHYRTISPHRQQVAELRGILWEANAAIVMGMKSIRSFFGAVYAMS